MPKASAQVLATTLVTERLVAGAKVLARRPGVEGWMPEVENAQEVPLLIKTTEDRYAAVEEAIRGAHPYELPEIIAVPIARGLPDYLNWVVAETRTETLAEPADGNSTSC